MATPDLTKLAETLAAGMNGKNMTCPHCKQNFAIKFTPKMAEQTKLTMTYTLQEGHMMQAVSIGESIAAFGRLLRATAKHIGGNVEVMVNDARFKEREISFDFVILEIPKRKGKTPEEPPRSTVMAG